MSEIVARAAAFDGVLRAHGVAASPARIEAFVASLAAVPLVHPLDVYWIARVALVASVDQIPRFDAAFAAYWLDASDAPIHGAAAPLGGVRLVGARTASSEDADRLTLALASSAERLRDRDFAAYTDEERAAALRLFARLRQSGERRRSRRRRTGAGGDRPDLRGTLRASRRTEFEPLELVRSERRDVLRPLIFVCDVSGSMEPYARAMLQYAAVAARARPRVRAFTFATRLHDVTSLVRSHDAASLLTSTARLVRDWGGGTRIGASLATFVEGYARRGIARGGTVAILSDGWERDDPALLAESMARLRRLTRRIVWINPRKRDEAFAPLTRGMSAAMPYVDAFVSGHNLRSLDGVAAAIEGTAPGSPNYAP